MAGRVAGAHGPHRCGGGVVDAHGWNISKRTCCSLTREHLGPSVVLVVSGVWCGGTLLGCRSTRRVGWFPAASPSADGCLCGCGVGGLLFVNYIVDASIFDAAHLVGVCGVFFDDCFVLCGV